jgi:phage baseplate assembly protein W
MSGINAETFGFTDPVEHIHQSVQMLLTTPTGERVMREWVGTPAFILLGQNNLNESTILLWWTVTWMVLDIYEPRLKNLRLIPLSTGQGTFDCIIAADEIPDGHIGFVERRLLVQIKDNTVSVSAAT